MSEKKEAFARAATESGQDVAGAGERGTGGSNTPRDEKVTENQPGVQKAPDQAVIPGILGKQLRAAYGELLSSPVPDRFNDLIKKLQHKENESAATAVGDEEESA